MRDELETLLNVIGTDEEVGTHASTLKYYALTTAIELGKDIYGRFEGVSLDREGYRQALYETIPFLNLMSTDSFWRLMNFTEKMSFIDRPLGEKIKKANVLPAWCEEQVDKRGMFLQYFSRVKPSLFTLEELEKEKEVKAQCPWQWIDAVNYINTKRAQEEAVSLLVAKKDIDSFILKLDSYNIASQKWNMETIMNNVRGKIPDKDYKKLYTFCFSGYEK